MSDVVWISANRFGRELLAAALDGGLPVERVITLAEDATTVMYDGVPPDSWPRPGPPVETVRTLDDARESLGAARLAVLAGWRQWVGPEILELPALGFVGFHPTLLPVGRGPAPIINTILHGFEESGVTLFHVVEELDAGDVIGQVSFSVAPNDHAGDLYEKAIVAGRTLARGLLPRVLAGDAPRKPQDSGKALVFPKPSLRDNRLDPGRESAADMERKIRAFSHPYRGAYLEVHGERVIVWRGEWRRERAGEP